jgi:pimeloyl-ACP methyl ester carboxylesterase
MNAQLPTTSGAARILELLEALDLTGVMVVGNSLGGRIAAEMAARDTQGRIGALTLLNALGIEPDRTTTSSTCAPCRRPRSAGCPS